MNRTTPTKELTEKYQALASDAFKEVFEVCAVDACNFKPHPYTIGEEHVALASDKYGGILGGEVVEQLGCAHREKGSYRKCGLSMEKHVHDTLLFLKLKRNANPREAGALVLTLKEAMEADQIDGVCFVDTPEKFRFVEDEPKETT